MDEAAHKAIADIEAGRQVVCTMEEYYATVRMALQRYAMAQAAQGNPEIVARGDHALGYGPGGRLVAWRVSLTLGTAGGMGGATVCDPLPGTALLPACARDLVLIGIGRVGNDL
jgi:hypothetical protein